MFVLILSSGAIKLDFPTAVNLIDVNVSPDKRRILIRDEDKILNRLSEIFKNFFANIRDEAIVKSVDTNVSFILFQQNIRVYFFFLRLLPYSFCCFYMYFLPRLF